MEKESEKEDTISMDTTSPTNKDEGDDVTLPGFRFHPTDDELVGFYLRRKVGKKPLKVELINQLDIYKFDPWDLPKTSSSTGDKERYFFCKRGRKYRNSVRPNRVTGSGFWKATGIDKPVHAKEGDCIGLKKTLVYYRGTAGKGTKTDWMMHEFRLPTTTNNNDNTIAAANKNSLQEAEVWTLCRVFKRNTSYKKYTTDWRELSSRRQLVHNASSINSISVMDDSTSRETHMCFSAPEVLQQYDQKPNVLDNYNYSMNQWGNFLMSTSNSQPTPSSSMASSSSNFPVSPYGNEFFSSGDWDELGSVVDFAINHVENSTSIKHHGML